MTPTQAKQPASLSPRDSSVAEALERKRKRHQQDFLLDDSTAKTLGWGVIGIGVALIAALTVSSRIGTTERVPLELVFTTDGTRSLSATGNLAEAEELRDRNVRVEVDGYPGQRFGWLEGTIAPAKGERSQPGFAVQVDFSAGPVTSTGVRIEVEKGVRGHCSVALQKRLLDRLLAGLYRHVKSQRDAL
jgi:hypothetical protein